MFVNHPCIPGRWRKAMPRHLATAAAAVALATTPALAATGKLRLTSGVSTVEGAAGGGLSPWALIGSQAAAGELGASVQASRAVTQDYGLTTRAVTLGLDDRVEVSFGQQILDTGITGGGLGLPGLVLQQQVLGAKLRLAGEAILDSDSLMPQLAIGLQHKRLQSSGLDGTLQALGARRSGTDVYLSASKLFLAQAVLVNVTLRATQANQNGLLGFGARLGGARNGYQLQAEAALALLLRSNLAVGLEYRSMPDKLQRAGQAAGLGDGLRADDWKDVFLVWAPVAQVSLTAAYLDLGRIVPATTAGRRQRGAYLAAQLAF